MKWGVTLMPTMTFFLYIGIQTVNQMANWTGRAPSADGTIQGTLNGIIQMLIIGGIMVAGLKIGISAGGISATAALGAAGKVTGMAAKPLMGARMRVGGREYGIKPGAQRVAGWGAGILNRVGNVPVLGAVTGARYGAAALSKVGHADEHDAQEYQKNVLKDLNDHDLFAFKGKNRIEDAAHLKELAARKKVGDFINDSHANRDDRVAQLQRLTAAAGTNNHKSGSDLTDIQEVKEALDSVPTLAPQLLGNRPGVVPPTPVRTITEQFARMTPNKIAELHPSTFDPMSPAGREALAAVGNNPSAIKSIFTNGSEQLRERISTGLNAMLDNAIPDPADRATYRGVRDRLESLDSDLSNARARNDNAAVANLQLERENLRTMVDPIIGRLDAAGEAQARAALNGENARIQVINRTTGNLV